MVNEVGLMSFLQNLLLLSGAMVYLALFGFYCIGIYTLYHLKIKSESEIRSLLKLIGALVILILMFSGAIIVVFPAVRVSLNSILILLSFYRGTFLGIGWSGLLLSLLKTIITTILFILAFLSYGFIFKALYNFSQQSIQSKYLVYEQIMESWKRFKQNRAAVIGLGVFCFIVLLAVFASRVAPYNPFKTRVGPHLGSPSREFPFGTDQIGRDILSGVIHGARTALLVALIAITISVTLAIVVGVLAGFFGGIVDMILMRIVEILLSIPNLIFAIIIVILYGIELRVIIMVIGFLSWPTLARIVRAEVLSLKEREFILAIRSVGASDLNIIFDEVFPNALPPLIPAATLQMATAILFEAALSFLGLSDPNVMSWGKQLWVAQQSFYAGIWWSVIFPGIFIIVTALSMSMIGDGLNDALNPKLR